MSDGRSWAVAVRNPVKDPDAIVDPDVRAQTLRTITASPYPAYRARRSAWSPATFMVALAALVVAGSVLFAVTRQGTIGGLPGAATALANVIESKDTIIHVVSNGDDAPDAGGGAKTVRQEQWVTTDGRYTGTERVLTTRADGSFEDYRSVVEPTRRRWVIYRSKTNTLTINPWMPVRERREHRGRALLEQAQSYVRAVRDGSAKLDGETTVRGVPAYRIVPTDPSSTIIGAWYVSRDEDDPRMLRIDYRCSGTEAKPQCPVEIFDVYETTNDRSVLRLPKRPGQKVERLSLDRRPR